MIREITRCSDHRQTASKERRCDDCLRLNPPKSWKFESAVVRLSTPPFSEIMETWASFNINWRPIFCSNTHHVSRSSCSDILVIDPSIAFRREYFMNEYWSHSTLTAKCSTVQLARPMSSAHDSWFLSRSSSLIFVYTREFFLPDRLTSMIFSSL